MDKRKTAATHNYSLESAITYNWWIARNIHTCAYSMLTHTQFILTLSSEQNTTEQQEEDERKSHTLARRTQMHSEMCIVCALCTNHLIYTILRAFNRMNFALCPLKIEINLRVLYSFVKSNFSFV